MKKVYYLRHTYEEIDKSDETKVLGIYSTEEKGKLAIEYYKTLSGFKDYPNNFYLDEYELNKNEWAEGFVFIEVDCVRTIVTNEGRKEVLDLGEKNND